MAASDSTHMTRAARAKSPCLSCTGLIERLREEISRAERHGTALSCLLVSIDDLDSLARSYGKRLPEQALAYLAQALGRQLRQFDRIGRPADGELLVILPGADEQRAEIVARRSLGRLHAVKIELDGHRRPLGVSVGIAAWQDPMSVEELIARVRAAARCGQNGATDVDAPAREPGVSSSAATGAGRRAAPAPRRSPS